MTRERRRRSSGSVSPYARAFVAYVAATLLLLVAGAIIAASILQASTDIAAVEADEPMFVRDGRPMGEDLRPLFTSDDQLLLPVDFVQEYADTPVYVDRGHGDEVFVVWPMDGLLFETQVGEEHAWVNEEPTNLAAPTYEIEGDVYISADFAELMGMVFEYHAETNRVAVRYGGESVVEAVVQQVAPPEGTAWRTVTSAFERIAGPWMERESVPMRTEPTERAPILFHLAPDDAVEVLDEDSGWYEVTYRGVRGFLPVTGARVRGTTIVREPKHDAREIGEESLPPMTERWSKDTTAGPDELISLVWEQVGYRTPNPADIDPVPQVNVISPTWFHLTAEDGQLRNLADSEYVRWAHDHDMKVWALVSNSFDPELTSAVLNDRRARRNVIRQLLHYARLYELDGINVDFENMYQEDRDRFTQFVHELSALARPLGLRISVDVTTISTSPTWSLCYDRAGLAQAADYIILMAYDQHTAGSAEAGSVATLPWVERGLRGVLEEVPADQLVLGVPFYMRIWEESRGSDDDSVDLSARAVGMQWFENHLTDRRDEMEWDEAIGQHYLEFEDSDETVYRIWVEDEHSLRARLSLVDKYDLAGVAAWRRGLETPEVWDIINEAMRRVP